MSQVYQQVSGGSCSLTMYFENAPGQVAPGTKGTTLALYTEGFRAGSSKKQRTVINGKRGPGKPYFGLPQMSGQLESAAYVPQLGLLLRALCGAPVTKNEPMRSIDTAAAVEVTVGVVGIPCIGHGFVQDAVVSVVGTENYDGIYRVEAGTTDDMVAIAAPFVAETFAGGCNVMRGRVALLTGDAAEHGSGKVALSTKGGFHSLNAGEKVTLQGTTHYDGVYVLQEGSERDVLIIEAAFTAESFDGTQVAIPSFYAHTFTLPKRQPTVCLEKHIDYEDGAAENPFTRFGFCKVNGLSFNFGGDDELKFSLDFSVGREFHAPAPLDTTPKSLPAVTLDNIETSVWVAGVRRGDVSDGSFTNSFGIEAKAAAGDLGKYSRMPEGDPDCKATLSVFLETDEMQKLVTSKATVPFALAMCAVTGDEVWFRYPEAELDSEGPAITGKAGLMQEFTVLAFVDKEDSVLRIDLVNRVPSYA